MVGVIQVSITTSLRDKFRAELAVRRLSNLQSSVLTNQASRSTLTISISVEPGRAAGAGTLASPQRYPLAGE